MSRDRKPETNEVRVRVSFRLSPETDRMLGRLAEHLTAAERTAPGARPVSAVEVIERAIASLAADAGLS